MTLETTHVEVASLLSFRLAMLSAVAACIAQARPNAAHSTLAKLKLVGYVKAIITQNIDVLHQKAGSQTVHEVHGTMTSLTCVSCYKNYAADDLGTSRRGNSSLPRLWSCA